MQHISREKREDDLPEGVLTVPLLKHQVYESCRSFYFMPVSYMLDIMFFTHLYCLKENGISLDGFKGE
jgi:hypothetical protein